MVLVQIPTTLLLALLLLYLLNSAKADCPDGYWDCLRNVSGVPQASGGISYGRCMDWHRRACLPCVPEDETNSARILGKCNAEAPQDCAGQCTW